MEHPKLPLEMLDTLQRKTFDYFIYEVNPLNGLVVDKTQKGSPASIAAVGLALSAFPVGVERAYMTRAEAVERTLVTLRFFRNSPQGEEADATGYKGFYYHFLDMMTGRRVWNCELSTVDTAFLLAGMLTAAGYFTNETSDECEIRALADELYRRVDWQWAQDGAPTVTHGWKPESGFLPYRWQGYDEALLLYFLGLGSPTHPLPQESYAAWTSTYLWKKVYDQEFLFSGPLFTHQISHLWVDFRGIHDVYMQGKGIDYFENSRRATYVQQQYAIRNPGRFESYSEFCWGITACYGPGCVSRQIHGKEQRFFGYLARGVPDGPDDGTIAPWAVATSLPFAPEIVLPALQYFDDLNLRAGNTYGYKSTFNSTFPSESTETPGWVSPWHLGLNQGPVVLMVENFRSGLIWNLMRECPYLVRGLRRAGFSGGWMDAPRCQSRYLIVVKVKVKRAMSSNSPRLPLVYLARHGETAWTISGQYTGVTDLPLTERGEGNARRLGDRIKDLKVAKVFTSPLRRALHTRELAGFGSVAVVDDDLVEWNYGLYDGKTTEEILKQRHGWELFRDGCPSGESVDDVAVRAKRVIERLRTVDGNVLLFSSSHFLRVLAVCWLGLESTAGQHFYLGTAALSIVGYNHGRHDPAMRLWNDCGHEGK